MILNMLEGKSLPVYGEGKNVRDRLYVEDHASAICVFMTRVVSMSGTLRASVRVNQERLLPPSIAMAREYVYYGDMPTHVSVNKKTDRELWTAGEFLEWLAPGVHADLIDGERFMHSPVSLRHAKLLNFVDRLLGSYIEVKDLGELYREVVAVRLSARNVFLPDLAFFTTEQVPRLGATFASEAPALVVEALSEWSADRDVGPKFAEYEHAGVREYWVLDPETLAHRFYKREGEILVEFAAGETVIRSEVVRGFWMERAWLDPDHLPKVTEALARLT